MSVDTSADRPERLRYDVVKSGSRDPRGSDDPERCFEIGQRVLKLLERGMHRAEVFGHPGKERVQGVPRMVDG